MLPQQIEPWGIPKEVEAGSVVWADALGGCWDAQEWVAGVCVMSASGTIWIVEETEAVKCTHHFCWFVEI